jgi:hypothetical protein
MEAKPLSDSDGWNGPDMGQDSPFDGYVTSSDFNSIKNEQIRKRPFSRIFRKMSDPPVAVVGKVASHHSPLGERRDSAGSVDWFFRRIRLLFSQ